MSVARLPALTPQPPATAQAPRDIRAAQRAFFAAATTESHEPAPIAAPSPTASAASSDPARPLRPGSLLDIRV